MGNFIKQLNKIEKDLLKRVTNEGYTLGDYQINICNGYLSQRLECFDDNEDYVVVTQEIEQDNGELIAMGLHYQY